MVRAALCPLRVSDGGCEEVCQPHGNRPFYSYYQISREDKSDAAETEPKKEGELTTHYENSHSPFGFLWQVATATGWTIDYILHKVNYQTLIMMLSDAPRYIEKRNSNPDAGTSAEDEANEIAGFFRSNLSQ